MDDIVSEKQLGLNCLVCNCEISSDSSYSIYYTVIPHSGTLLMNAIQKVIRKNLDQYLISSSFLCTKCFTLFEQLDRAEEKCKDLRSDIVQCFANNSKNVGYETNYVPGVGCQTENGCHDADEKQDEDNPDEKVLRSARSLRRYVHPCTECGRLFRRPCEVKQHLLSHTNAKPYKCAHCNRTFVSKNGASVHALKKHGIQESDGSFEDTKNDMIDGGKDEEEEEDDGGIEPQDVDPKDLLKPDTSSSESDDGNIKTEDFSWHDNDNDNDNGSEEEWDRVSDKAEVLDPEVLDPEVEIKVEQEGKVVKQRGRPKAGTTRKKVVKMRTEPKPRSKKTGGEQLRLDCSICGKQWRTRSELKAHVATHSTERPFICEICGQAYKHKPALDVHVGMHQGINPFCCPYCKKSFTQKGALQRHLPIHTGDAPFQCELCGKRFVHHTSFNMHTLAHTGEKSYKCGVCGLALLSASHLKRHTRVHTGERPYQCPTCGKRFAERYNLAAHQRIHQHSASKLHSCQLCGAGFDRKPKLEDHLASCHNKITDDRSSGPKLLPDDNRKWVQHDVQQPAWHHMIFDPSKLPEVLPSRGNMMQ